jgi:hypothetical protein
VIFKDLNFSFQFKYLTLYEFLVLPHLTLKVIKDPDLIYLLQFWRRRSLLFLHALRLPLLDLLQFPALINQSIVVLTHLAYLTLCNHSDVISDQPLLSLEGVVH